MTVNINTIEQLLTEMARGDMGDLSNLIGLVKSHKLKENQVECYHLKVDANGRPRLAELIKYMSKKITDYAIPRSKIVRAQKALTERGCTDEFTRIVLEARSLFTKLEQSGEGGELLLFALTESILKYPQILCKMSLKTDEQVHFHGADGVFLGVDDSDMLCVYWGESKLHASHSSALSDCVESIASILKMEPDVDSDIRLIDYIDLGNSNLESAIKNYFDYSSPYYDKLRSCAVCLLAFDHVSYKNGSEKLNNEDIQEKINKTYDTYWKKNLEEKLKENGIEHCKIIFFYLPVNSVEELRYKFRAELGLTA